ncbi:MAG: VOC family protein [Nevskia sp.]
MTRGSNDGCAPGSPWLIPTLVVRTAEAAIDFYQRAFGFSVDFTMPSPAGAIGYAQLRHRKALIHVSPEGAYGSSCQAPVTAAAECPAMLYVYCADVDALVRQARAAGATILSEPADMFWGDRVASLLDPEGYRWAFATHIGAFDSTRTPTTDYPKPG